VRELDDDAGHVRGELGEGERERGRGLGRPLLLLMAARAERASTRSSLDFLFR
jgi:hypothetical protein